MTDNSAPQPEFAIQRVYVKDSSFEAPNTPSVFLKEWKPEVKVELQTDAKKVEADLHEVTVMLTITAELGDETAFVVEVVQAGLFTMKHIPEEQVGPMLGSFCPNILFPYARQVVSELVTQGGFPQLFLAPLNFDQLYQQKLAKEKEQADAKASA